MLRLTPSIGPSPLVATEARRSNSGVRLLLADGVEKAADEGGIAPGGAFEGFCPHSDCTAAGPGC